MSRARIVITNYHAFQLKDAKEIRGIAKNTRLLLKGDKAEDAFKETPKTMVSRVLRDLGADKGQILVLNDEAHHCYMDKPLPAGEKASTEEAAANEEARVWFKGLQAIVKHAGIKQIFDLSATPFYLKGSGYNEDRAWGWALGENAIAPVTDRPTAVPPSRSDIEAEIMAANESRLRGDRVNRADAAATILCWLIGDDDHVPVHGENRGELVGGFGDVVRSTEQLSEFLALALEAQQQAVARSRDIDAGWDDRQFARQEADYLDGVASTFAWVVGQRPETPITRVRSRELTTRDLKSERVHADDVSDQARSPWIADRRPSARYGEGVKCSITWLLGDTTVPPVDPAGRGPYSQGSELSTMFRDAQVKQRRH